MACIAVASRVRSPANRTMRRKLIAAFVVAGGIASVATPVWAAGNNNSPPAGAILDLGGGETGTAAQTINHGAPVQEEVSFVAGITDTDVTFAFREDPAFISFSDVALVNTTTGSSVNLITNGSFSAGTYTSNGNTQAPIGWTYANVYGATYGGIVENCSAFGGSDCWYDGSVQAYDAIDQTVATVIGDTYTLSFEYSDNSGLTTFSDLSTNGDTADTGGNGVDILAYAQAGLPSACAPGVICTSVPEPASLALLGFGVIGLGALVRMRRA